MHDDVSAEILEGIRSYLREHFPETEFSEQTEARTQSVIFHGSGVPGYRLAVTERFLDGDDGAAGALDCVRRWNVARTLREAGRRLVTVTTAGCRVEQ